MLRLMILCSLLTGASGDRYLNVIRSDGENVNLPCDNNHTDSRLTTWIYSGERSETVVLFEKGIKENDIKRYERLSLESDCSLNIYKITTEDRGIYTCRQYVNTETPYTDTNVHLCVLHVSPSSTQTEIRPGSSFTLSCQLHVYAGYPCDDFFTSERIQLIWVNKTGVNLQSDSRYQISSPHHCNITLTTTLLDEDHNTEWRCQVTDGSEVKTSARYTVTYSVNSSENKTLGGLSVRVIIIIAEIAALTTPTVILLWIICERRADNRRRGQDSQRTYMNVISEMNNAL
ncbi:uncharacterized protein LOC127494813 isoform X4 [Ctenopharyngodon idella]|uniref:uncharacterized protein LOC127494813 isoform X4 n=1 Tax=Ctenopharyngodon idella TaxID=7959 RepID=UPI00222E3293|nr:uncharacterized protein LOC127494813 isoform X4 [Ctenopharyngodon idella]